MYLFSLSTPLSCCFPFPSPSFSRPLRVCM
jgi:hypothetical protein